VNTQQSVSVAANTAMLRRPASRQQATAENKCAQTGALAD
jgi:hypothetical protein